MQFINFPSMQSAHVPLQNDKGVSGKSTQQGGFRCQTRAIHKKVSGFKVDSEEILLSQKGVSLNLER